MEGGYCLYSQQEMIKVAKMYYEMNMTQKQISEKLRYSRPTISRIVDAAIRKGIVEVKVNYTLSSVQELEKKIKEKFSLNKIFVIPVYVEDDTLIKNDIGKAVADYLYEICSDGTVLGVSWGTTMGQIMPYLKEKKASNMKIVQLNGGIAKNSFSTNSAALLEEFSKAFLSDYYLLPVPAIVDSDQIANAISNDSSIQETLLLGKQSNVAVFGIGNVSYESVLYKGGYFKGNAYEKLIEKEAVGDICSRFFTIDGGIADSELNRRTIGLQLEELRKKEYSIGIASGKNKLKSVLGALNGNFLNVLFIDEILAQEIEKRI
jgi:deoxyribonucleoside regulator